MALTFYPDAICLAVQDNGTGFDVEAARSAEWRSGFGLIGMQQRAHLLGGTLALESQNGRGTLVEVRIPMTQES